MFFVSIGSITIGAIGSINQIKIKRILAYTSVSQMGFCMLGILTNTHEGVSSALFFFMVYIISSIGVFIILLNTESMVGSKSMVNLLDLSKFRQLNPKIALLFSFYLLSMAGIPPLMGFFTKFFIFKSLINVKLYGLCIFSVIISTINSFIYIRMIKSMFFDISLEVIERQKTFVFCF